MNLIKSLWPTPFKIKKGNLFSFLFQLVVFLVLAAVAGLVIGFLSKVPVVGVVFTILGSLMGLYTLIGIILCILKFLGVKL